MIFGGKLDHHGPKREQLVFVKEPGMFLMLSFLAR